MFNLTDTTSKIEARAGRLLSQFDPGMYADYSKKTRLLYDEYRKNISDYKEIDFREEELVTGDKHPVFYITFNEPVYITFSNPLSIFRRKTGKRVGIKGEEHFYYETGMIPVYFASMNAMSMLKLYQDRAAKIFDPSGRFFDNMRCIELSHKQGCFKLNPVNFSSMNIIEQSRAKENLADGGIAKLFYDKYFTLGFWLQPGKGYTPSTHFDFGQKMNAIFKLSKSVYTVESLGEKETSTLLGNEIDTHEAILRGVWVDTLQLGSPFKAKIESSVLEQTGYEKSNSDVFLNGIMMEIRNTKNTEEKNHEKIMIVCASHAKSYFDILQVAIGMLCYRICRDNRIVSFLGDLESFKGLTDIICKDWIEQFKIEIKPSELSNRFDEALELMFPLIVSNASAVYHTNPVIIGFLKKWSILVTDAAEQKKILLLLLPLLDIISKTPYAERTSVKKNEKFLELLEIVNHDSKFLSSLIRLVQEINLLNLIRNIYQREFNQYN